MAGVTELAAHFSMRGELGVVADRLHLPQTKPDIVHGIDWF